MDEVKLLPCDVASDEAVIWAALLCDLERQGVAYGGIDIQSLARAATRAIEATRPPIVTDEVVELRRLVELYRDIFSEITAKAQPECADESDPERITSYWIPVGPIHRAAGRIGFQMFNGEAHIKRLIDDLAEARAAIAALPTIDQDGGELRGKRPRIPTPEMIAAAWAVIERDKKATGVAKLGPGLGVREIWQAMYDAANEPPAQPENDQCQD